MLKTLYKDTRSMKKHTHDTEQMLHMEYQPANGPQHIKGKSTVSAIYTGELEREENTDCRYYIPKYFQKDPEVTI